MTRVTFHVEAEAELVAAAASYETHQAGLGLGFVAEVGAGDARLGLLPEDRPSILAPPSSGTRSSHMACCIESTATRFVSSPLRTCGGNQGTGVTGEPPSPRLQRTALRAAAEAPSRWAARRHFDTQDRRTQMPAYIVIHNVVTDPTELQRYVPKAVDTLTAHGAEILVVADSSTVLEGRPSFPRTIILKFASREAAQSWYDSADYQQVLPLRLQATEGYAVLVDGLPA